MFQRLVSIDKCNSHWHCTANARKRYILAPICPHTRFSEEIKAEEQPPTWPRAHKQGDSLLRFRGSLLAPIRTHLLLTVCLASRAQLSLKISRRRHTPRRILFGKRFDSKCKSLFRSCITPFSSCENTAAGRGLPAWYRYAAATLSSSCPPSLRPTPLWRLLQACRGTARTSPDHVYVIASFVHLQWRAVLNCLEQLRLRMNAQRGLLSTARSIKFDGC